MDIRDKELWCIGEFSELTGMSRSVIMELKGEGMPYIQRKERGRLLFDGRSLEWIKGKFFREERGDGGESGEGKVVEI